MNADKIVHILISNLHVLDAVYSTAKDLAGSLHLDENNCEKRKCSDHL